MTQTAQTSYDCQGYDETTLIFPVLQSHTLIYFVQSDYAYRNKQALVAFNIKNRNTTQYIDIYL